MIERNLIKYIFDNATSVSLAMSIVQTCHVWEGGRNEMGELFLPQGILSFVSSHYSLSSLCYYCRWVQGTFLLGTLSSWKVESSVRSHDMGTFRSSALRIGLELPD